MRIERLNLADDGRVSLTAYLLDTSTELPALDKRPAVVICPGGGYAYTSDREAEPIALTFSAQGYQTFVLRYSIKEYAAFPNSLVDLAKAVALIRRQADDLNIFAERIAVAGFSAGGHLAASLGVFWNDPEIQALAKCSGEENKPNALVLCYPVIASVGKTHKGSIDILLAGLNGQMREAQQKRIALHLHVGAQTPPCFLMHTYFDQLVPVENTLLFAQALAEHGIPFELHIPQDGVHGLALANAVTAKTQDGVASGFAEWPALCGRWLNNLFDVYTMQPKTYPSALTRTRPFGK